MAKHTPVEIDPKQVRHAQDTWAGFTTLMKYSVIAIMATLAGLALAFIDW